MKGYWINCFLLIWKLTKLRKLKISYFKSNLSLSKVTNLEQLELNGDIKLIDLPPSITSLSTMNKVDKCILSLPNLCYLSMKCVSDKTLKRLTALKNLKFLNVSGSSRITEESIPTFKKFKNLRELNLDSCAEISDVSLLELRKNPLLHISHKYK